MRYQIWNKTDDIITPSGAQFTASEWANRYPWAKLPGVKMVITAGPINGGCALEYTSMVERCKKAGAAINDVMNEEEILAAIEDFEDNPPDPGPSVEERTAAALEAQVLLMTPSERNEVSRMANDGVVGESPAYDRIRRNYDRGLWSAALVEAAFTARQINKSEMEAILG